ncbi:MAG: hypothetical protein ABSC20_11190 [Candidatus Bathyarchaeia archaeon]
MWIIIHRKPVFALAAVFLAIALVAPPIILMLQADKDFNNYVSARNNPGLSASGNATSEIYTMHEHLQTTFTLIVIIEAIFVTLFAITIWFGISTFILPLNQKAPCHF